MSARANDGGVGMHGHVVRNAWWMSEVGECLIELGG